MTATMELTPTNIEEEIQRLSSLLLSATEENAKLARIAADTEVDFKAAYASALLTAEFSPDEKSTELIRKAKADQATLTSYRARKTAEAVHGANVEMLRSVRASLSALQTLSANVRALV